MFDLADKRLVWIPVKWPGVKANDEGIAEPHTHQIECQVELVDQERLNEIFHRKDEAEGEDEPEAREAAEIVKFRGLVHDWRGVKLGTQSAPMTDENIALILKVPMFATGFENSYIDAWTGQLEAREKNSNASSGAGALGGGRGKKTKG
jgi:hypothetical protein